MFLYLLCDEINQMERRRNIRDQGVRRRQWGLTIVERIAENNLWTTIVALLTVIAALNGFNLGSSQIFLKIFGFQGFQPILDEETRSGRAEGIDRSSLIDITCVHCPWIGGHKNGFLVEKKVTHF